MRFTGKPVDSNASQADKFREAVKQVEADDDERRFDERLRKIAKPAKHEPERSKS